MVERFQISELGPELTIPVIPEYLICNIKIMYDTY